MGLDELVLKRNYRHLLCVWSCSVTPHPALLHTLLGTGTAEFMQLEHKLNRMYIYAYARAEPNLHMCTCVLLIGTNTGASAMGIMCKLVSSHASTSAAKCWIID
jgi:hypothetical protein